MSAEEPMRDDQLSLCSSLAPKIIRATENFFDPDQPHPFLDGLAQGGLITNRPEEDTKETEVYLVTEAHGFRDTLMPTKFEKIGIPAEVARNGLMWVVMTKKVEYEKPEYKGTGQRSWSSLDHSFAYWAGNAWQVARLKGNVSHSDAWESKWESSELSEMETKAIQTTATQTRDVHHIAEVFDGDNYLFERTILNFPRDIRGLALLSRGLQFAFNTPRYGQTLEYGSLPAYMIYHGTGYMNSEFIHTAHSLNTNSSYNLDSGGVMNAMYHGSYMPPVPEMLEKGLNIPLVNLHPPVPVEYID